MKYLFSIIFASTLFASCESFFSQTVEIDPPEYTPSMVFHQTIGDQEDSIRLTLSRNYGVLEPINDQTQWFVKNAVVEWWENGQKALTLLPLSADSGFVYVGKFPAPLQSGHNYEIKVTHPDFEPVTAEQTMPSPVGPIKDIRVRRRVSTGQFNDTYGEVEFSLDDKAGEKNYYEFILTSINSYLLFNGFDPDGNAIYDTLYYPVVFNFETTFDPNIKEGLGGSTMVADQFFDGQTYKFKGQFPDYQPVEDSTIHPLYLTVRSVTPAYYYWSKSYYQQSNDSGNPFVEPVTVYNNLVNGLGIFGMFSERKFQLQ